jgi:hypothetical protein
MYEIDEAAKAITEAADPDANIIFGTIIDETMQGEVKITVVATGFENEQNRQNANRRFIVGATPSSQGANYPAQPNGVTGLGGLPYAPQRREEPMRQQEPEPMHQQPMQPEPMPTRQQPNYPQFDDRPVQPPRRPEFDQQEEQNGEELDVPTFIRRKLK